VLFIGTFVLREKSVYWDVVYEFGTKLNTTTKCECLFCVVQLAILFLGHCIWTTWECVGTTLCMVVILCHGLAWHGMAIDDMCVYVLTFFAGRVD
jgi:hypothetical protein